MGLSEMSLKEAYAFCDKKEDLAKDCAYQIWQADLMALRPGSENTQAALSAAEEVYSRHAPFALERNPRFRTRFWTWFWGSWWKEQPRQKIGGIEQCDSFDSAKARRRCIQWSEVAWDWLIGRTGGLPEID